MKIKHPTIAHLDREVPDKSADDWLAAGWVRIETAQPQNRTRRTQKKG